MNSLPPPDASKPTRRTLLTWGGAFVGGTTASIVGWRLAQDARQRTAHTPAPNEPVPQPATTAPTAPTLVDTPLRHEVFSPLLNETFQLGERGIPCQLVEVTAPQTTTTLKGTFVTFSLLFELPPYSVDTDGAIHNVRHATAGSFEMFLTPVGKPDRKQMLQAVCSARAV